MKSIELIELANKAGITIGRRCDEEIFNYLLHRLHTQIYQVFGENDKIFRLFNDLDMAISMAIKEKELEKNADNMR